MNGQFNQEMVGATMIDDTNTRLSQAASTVTNDSILNESVLSPDMKKRKLEEIYSNGKFQDEDEYEVLKVRKVVRQHIFKHLKFCKGEGTKSANNFEKKKKRQGIWYITQKGRFKKNYRIRVQCYETDRILQTKQISDG